MNTTAKFFADVKQAFLLTDKLAIHEITEHEFFPKNLQTPAKLKFIDSLPDEITEKQFVELLQYQTIGADYVNVDYLLDYYGTKCDDNMMPIFTDDFLYMNLKPQALYTYVIVKNLQTHPIFKNYQNLLQFTFEKRLETNLFPANKNFKYDLAFNDRNIAIEIDEEHHKIAKSKNRQNYIDEQKTALVKILGKVLFRIKTFDVVDIKKIKTRVYDNRNVIFNKIQKTISCEQNTFECILRRYANIKFTKEMEKYYKTLNDDDSAKESFDNVYKTVKKF